MRLFITGCSGFIGGSLGRSAAAQGHTVFGVGRSAQAPPLWRGAYAQADVARADLEPLLRDFQPEVVFHGAGSASVGSSFQRPFEDLEATVSSFGHVLQAVWRAGSRPLILFPSSAAVYGNPALLPVPEEAPIQPVSPYGFHKAMCEMLAREYAQCFGLRILLCRLFSVFGPGQRRLLVYELYRQAAHAEALRLEGTGRETRDYLFSEDLAELLLRLAAAELPQREAPAALGINVASGNATRIFDLAERMVELSGRALRIETASQSRPGDPLHWQADVAQLHRRIEPLALRSLEEGLRLCREEWQA